MKVGVPTEIKPDEYRVALTPGGRARADRARPRGARAGRRRRGVARSPTRDYEAQGARIVPDAEAVFAEAELVLGVKEPQPDEVDAAAARAHAVHLPAPGARARADARRWCESGATCIAYETVEDARGRLPLLAPMSEVAGKIATQAGAFMLEQPLGGRGVLLGGVPGRGRRDRARDRRRRRRLQRGVDRDRHGGRRVRLRPQHRPPARARRGLRRARLDRLLLDAGDRGDAAAGRPRDRRGARPRRARPARDHAASSSR